VPRPSRRRSRAGVLEPSIADHEHVRPTDKFTTEAPHRSEAAGPVRVRRESTSEREMGQHLGRGVRAWRGTLSSDKRPRHMTTQDSGARNRGRGSATIEARYPVAAHARGHNLEFRAPVQSHLVQGVGTTSSGRALRRTGVPRRSYSTASSYSSSSSSMLVAWRSPIDQRATIRMMLNPTYQSPF